MRAFTKSIAGAVSALASASALAHGGHATAPGVPQSGHFHLWNDVAVGPQWLLMLGLALVLAAVGWRFRRGTRHGRAPVRGGERRGSRRAAR